MPSPNTRPSAVTIAVVTEETGMAERVRLALGTSGGRLHRQRWRNGEESLEAARIVKEVAAENAVVLCVGHDVPVRLALGIAVAADRDHPEINVILVAPSSTKLWRHALRSGVRDIIDPEQLDTELEPALRFALDRTQRLRTQGAATAAPPTGRVVVVLSPKGGSGKTMVASNLAAALARTVEGSVVLVDLDVQFGDAAYAFGLVPEHTIGQLAQAPTIDSTTLKVFLTPHSPSGAFVLCGAESPQEGEAVTEQHASRILQLLAHDFPWVIVDTPAGLDERTLASLEMATDAVLVSSMDVSSIRNLGKSVVVLDQLEMLPANRFLVLNRSDARVGVEVADVPVALGLEITAAIPSSRAIPVSMNQGRPIVVDEPTSPVGKALIGLAQLLAGQTDAQDGRRRFIRRKR
jgi:pilus assembly protein CpaE